jgi:signal transduction histidine kinase
MTETNLRRVARRTTIDSAYVLIGFPLAIVTFVILVTGVSTGVGSVFVFGFPILAATLYAARAFADLERLRIGQILDRTVARPAYKSAPEGAGIVRRILTPIIDGQAWLDVLHGVLVLIVSTVTFSFVLTWWAGMVGGLLYVTYGWAIPEASDNQDLPQILGMPGLAGRTLLYTGAGIFFLGTLPSVARGCAVAQASLGRALLSGVAELRQRISGLEREKATAEAQKAAAVSAEAIALRRLERDIHDGPQQRLVRLAMDIGRAQQQLDNDPEAARNAMAEALAQTQETLEELRALSRGIAPPILADRGLPAAMAALAGRSTVPVTLDVAELGRLNPAVENTAYFVVAESLANAAKHSVANECRISLDRLGDRLLVIVADDGVGGAHLAKGHGLTGLTDRTHAIGGTLTVDSPPGGPTTITAELPWK